MGLTVVGFIFLVAVGAPIVNPYDPTTDSNLAESRQAPSGEHPFGTDRLGRDMLRRIVHGARISLIVGLLVVLGARTMGVTLGMLSGYLGGAPIRDHAGDGCLAGLSRHPAGDRHRCGARSGLPNTMLAVAVVGIPGYARVMRSMVLSFREREYVLAARWSAHKDRRIMFRHIFPNSLSPLIVQVTLGIGGAILFAAALGFLGLGAQPPLPNGAP